MRLTLLFLLACTGTPTKDDTGAEPADTDTDTDSDTDTDTDTDTDPRDASIGGMVLLWDGAPAADMEVQVCSTLCRYARTDANGNFDQGGLEGAPFKIDAVGATYGTPGYGNALYGVDLTTSQAFSIPAPMVVPPVEGPVLVPETAGSDTYTMGRVSLTFAASTLDLPFGVTDENDNIPLYAGALEGDVIPDLWSVDPAFVVTMLPWGVEPTEGMDIEVTGLSVADGTYDVYALEEYGGVEGLLGTATVSGGTATATGIQVSYWTWILFVPQ